MAIDKIHPNLVEHFYNGIQDYRVALAVSSEQKSVIFKHVHQVKENILLSMIIICRGLIKKFN